MDKAFCDHAVRAGNIEFETTKPAGSTFKDLLLE